MTAGQLLRRKLMVHGKLTAAVLADALLLLPLALFADGPSRSANMPLATALLPANSSSLLSA